MKLLITLFFSGLIFASQATGYELSDVASARIETCRGCSLNRLPEVKGFVMGDAPDYDRVEVKFISGAIPEFVLLNEHDHELERIPLSELTREQCNQLVQSKGFQKKSNKSDL